LTVSGHRRRLPFSDRSPAHRVFPPGAVNSVEAATIARGRASIEDNEWFDGGRVCPGVPSPPFVRSQPMWHDSRQGRSISVARFRIPVAASNRTGHLLRRWPPCLY
jgi:hypothetical protein